MLLESQQDGSPSIRYLVLIPSKQTPATSQALFFSKFKGDPLKGIKGASLVIEQSKNITSQKTT